MMKIKIVLIGLLYAFTLSGCSSGEESSPASAAPPSTPPPTGQETPSKHFFIGKSQVTADGWSVLENQSSQIQSKTLANGWKVEVRYE